MEEGGGGKGMRELGSGEDKMGKSKAGAEAGRRKMEGRGKESGGWRSERELQENQEVRNMMEMETGERKKRASAWKEELGEEGEKKRAKEGGAKEGRKD
jgi:hypothetical protein